MVQPVDTTVPSEDKSPPHDIEKEASCTIRDSLVLDKAFNSSTSHLSSSKSEISSEAKVSALKIDCFNPTRCYQNVGSRSDELMAMNCLPWKMQYHRSSMMGLGSMLKMKKTSGNHVFFEKIKAHGSHVIPGPGKCNMVTEGFSSDLSKNTTSPLLGGDCNAAYLPAVCGVQEPSMFSQQKAKCKISDEIKSLHSQSKKSCHLAKGASNCTDSSWTSPFFAAYHCSLRDKLHLKNLSTGLIKVKDDDLDLSRLTPFCCNEFIQYTTEWNALSSLFRDKVHLVHVGIQFSIYLISDTSMNEIDSKETLLQVSLKDCLYDTQGDFPHVGEQSKETEEYVASVCSIPKAAKDGELDFMTHSTLLQCRYNYELDWQSTGKVQYSETPQVELTSPPQRNYSKLASREGSYQSVRNLPVSAQILANCGFFWNGDNVECFSCNQDHLLRDVVEHPSAHTLHLPSCQRNGSFSSGSTLNLAQCSGREIVTDGVVLDDTRDPPGQLSVYIAPGDVRLESYRLSTFNNFPSSSPIDQRGLASAGFYFTGYNDRVKCFACAIPVENWEANDDPGDVKWHKESCLHARGSDCGNVPISNVLTRILRPSNLVSRNPQQGIRGHLGSPTGPFVPTAARSLDEPERARQNRPGHSQQRSETSTSIASNRPSHQWRMGNVISADHRRFLNNLYLNRELDRLASFTHWPMGRPNISPTDLAKNGFFYLGNLDRTQCFSCGGVLKNWTINDTASAEHRTHFRECRFVRGTETRNVPIPLQVESPDVRQRNFPCQNPVSSHMRSEAARCQTFDNRWHAERLAATAEEIAQAGFYFTGETDRVKCWYCNGGLQHWEYDDAPWIEHAKYFPNCQFLLSVKGQHFVYRHLARSAHLSRPPIARQLGSPLDPPMEEGQYGYFEIPNNIPRAHTPPPTIVDPQEERRKIEERVEKSLKKSDIVKNVLTMGFPENIVRSLLQEKAESGSAENSTDLYETVSELLNDVMRAEEEVKRQEDERLDQAAAVSEPPASLMPSSSSVNGNPEFFSFGPPGSGKYNASYIGVEDEDEAEPMSETSSFNSVTQDKQHGDEQTAASIQKALNKIEEERMCKICFSNQADIFFVQCQHMCCCQTCTEAIKQCPICRVGIKTAIKTYWG